MNKNNDGLVTADEFFGTDEMYTQLDLDSSGYVTLKELESWDRKGGEKKGRSKGKRDPQKLLDRMDANKDGRISKNEFRGRSEMFLAKSTPIMMDSSPSTNWEICRVDRKIEVLVAAEVEVADSAAEVFRHHLFHRKNWPGNIRELQNAIERALIVSRTNEIKAEDLPSQLMTGDILYAAKNDVLSIN